MSEVRTSSRKTRVGLVVSDKMDKTVVVAIADRVAHPLYKKIVKRTYKLKAHDEQNACGVGDKVKVMVGGAPVTQMWADKIGADAFTADAAEAAQWAKTYAASKGA